MKTFVRMVRPLLVAVALWLTPALAWAQDFEKVTGAMHEELPAGRFVAAAYGFIWIAVLLYVVSIARGLGRVRKDLSELRSKIDRAAGPRP